MRASGDELHVVMLTIVALCVVYIMFGVLFNKYKHRKGSPSCLHEASIIYFVAMGMGCLIYRFSDYPISLNPQLLYYLVLPPFLFSAGYYLKQKRFFEYFHLICCFGIVGTACQFLLLTMAAYLFDGIFSTTFPRVGLTWCQCLLLSSVLCASDESRALSVMNINTNTEKKLKKQWQGALISGEGVMNNGLSIVLFNSILPLCGQELQQLSSSSSSNDNKEGGSGAGGLLLTLASCAAVELLYGTLAGVSCGLLNAKLMKQFDTDQRNPVQQVSLVALTGCLAFLLAEQVLGVSGIFATFVAAMTMAHYSWHSLGVASQAISKAIAASMADIAQGFAFSYVGLCFFWLYSGDNAAMYACFGIYMIISMLLARMCTIFGLFLIGRQFCDKFNAPLGEQMAFVLGGSVRGCLCWAQAFQVVDCPVLTSCACVVVLGTSLVSGVVLPLLLPASYNSAITAQKRQRQRQRQKIWDRNMTITPADMRFVRPTVVTASRGAAATPHDCVRRSTTSYQSIPADITDDRKNDNASGPNVRSITGRSDGRGADSHTGTRPLQPPQSNRQELRGGEIGIELTESDAASMKIPLFDMPRPVDISRVTPAKKETRRKAAGAATMDGINNDAQDDGDSNADDGSPRWIGYQNSAPVGSGDVTQHQYRPMDVNRSRDNSDNNPLNGSHNSGRKATPEPAGVLSLLVIVWLRFDELFMQRFFGRGAAEEDSAAAGTETAAGSEGWAGNASSYYSVSALSPCDAKSYSAYGSAAAFYSAISGSCAQSSNSGRSSRRQALLDETNNLSFFSLFNPSSVRTTYFCHGEEYDDDEEDDDDAEDDDMEEGAGEGNQNDVVRGRFNSSYTNNNSNNLSNLNGSSIDSSSTGGVGLYHSAFLEDSRNFLAWPSNKRQQGLLRGEQRRQPAISRTREQTGTIGAENSGYGDVNEDDLELSPASPDFMRISSPLQHTKTRSYNYKDNHGSSKLPSRERIRSDAISINQSAKASTRRRTTRDAASFWAGCDDNDAHEDEDDELLRAQHPVGITAASFEKLTGEWREIHRKFSRRSPDKPSGTTPQDISPWLARAATNSSSSRGIEGGGKGASAAATGGASGAAGASSGAVGGDEYSAAPESASMTAARPGSMDSASTSSWVYVFENESHPYYWNTATNETTYERPPDFTEQPLDFSSSRYY